MNCMKKFFFAGIMCVALLSCNDQRTGSAAPEEATKTNAAANDSTAHPDGTTNSSAISTDTAAMKPHTGPH